MDTVPKCMHCNNDSCNSQPSPYQSELHEDYSDQFFWCNSPECIKYVEELIEEDYQNI